MESKTLVILINNFGWDFLEKDLPEDRVATRPDGLSLSDLIYLHLHGLKVGRREEPGSGLRAGSGEGDILFYLPRTTTC